MLPQLITSIALAFTVGVGSGPHPVLPVQHAMFLRPTTTLLVKMAAPEETPTDTVADTQSAGGTSKPQIAASSEEMTMKDNAIFLGYIAMFIAFFYAVSSVLTPLSMKQ